MNLETAYRRPSSEEAVIRGAGAKGVLFKESHYPGWTLNIKSGGNSKDVKIYEAGPLVYGYMYAFVPQEMRQGSIEATFKYHGEWVYKLAYLVSLISLAIVLDKIFFGNRLTFHLGRRGRSVLARSIGKWWEKEDED